MNVSLKPVCYTGNTLLANLIECRRETVKKAAQLAASMEAFTSVKICRLTKN